MPYVLSTLSQKYLFSGPFSSDRCNEDSTLSLTSHLCRRGVTTFLWRGRGTAATTAINQTQLLYPR
jgi:hypothetical protein